MPVNIVIDSKFDDKGIRDAQRQLKSFAGDAAKRVAQVGAAVAAAGAVAAGKLAVDAVNAASDFEESVNAVNVSFGEAAAGVLKIGENAAQSMGLSQNEFNQAATRFSAFAETVVGEGGDVAGFIGQVSQRAADFASVFNIDVSEALQVFQSGLAGEAEPLKRFGINLLQSEVAAFAMANGIASSAAEMTEAEKVQARYGLLLESTAKTQGDFQNTSDSLANSQRILRAQISNLQIEIGKALIPVAKDLVNTFGNALLPRLEEFGRWINSEQGIASVREFGEQLVALFEAALDFGGWVLDNLELLKNLGITIAAVTVGVKAYQAAVVVAAVAQRGLNAAMKSNPIGFLVGAFAAITTAVGAFTATNKEATPTQIELQQEILDTKEELKFYREEQEKSSNTSKLYQSQIEELEAKLIDLKEATGENVRFTKESVIATDRGREAAIANRIANENLAPALGNTGDSYFNLATQATNARLGIESVTIAEEAQRQLQYALSRGIDDQATAMELYEKILTRVTARVKFQTQGQAEFDEKVRDAGEALGLVVPAAAGAAGAASVLTDENEKLSDSYAGVTSQIQKATDAANQFRQATPGAPGPGGLFEVTLPDGSTALATEEGIQEGLRVAGTSGVGGSMPDIPRRVSLGFQGASTVEEMLERGFKQIADGRFEEIQLARGGLVTQPTRALIGEAGPEAVIPMSKLDRMMRGGRQGGGNTFNIYVQANSRISGAQAGEEVVNALKTYNTNNGDFNRALTGFGA